MAQATYQLGLVEEARGEALGFGFISVPIFNTEMHAARLLGSRGLCSERQGAWRYWGLRMIVAIPFELCCLIRSSIN